MLRIGGTFICTTPNRERAFTPEHEKFSPDSLGQMIEQSLVMENMWGVYKGFDPGKRTNRVTVYKVIPKLKRIINRLIYRFFSGDSLIKVEEIAFNLSVRFTRGYKPRLYSPRDHHQEPTVLIAIARKT